MRLSPIRALGNSVACAGAIGALASASYARPTLELVMKNSQSVPGISGVSWATGTSQFQGPSIDIFGSVGFRGTMLTGTGGVTSSNNSGMWYGTPGGLNLVARTGSQAPGLPGGVNSTSFQSQNLPLSPNGYMWFGGGTTSPSGYVATGTYAGGLASVSRNGETLPGAAAAQNSSPASNSGGALNVNNAGQALIFNSMSDSTLGLWVGGPGSLQKVFQSGAGDPGLPALATLNNTNGFTLNGNGAVLTSVTMNNAAGPGIVYGNNEAMATRAWNGSALNVIAREGAAAPGFGPGVNIASSTFDSGLGFDPSVFSFTHGNFNNAGRAVFSANVVGTGITAGVNDATVFYHDGASTSVMRRKGDSTSAVAGATMNVSNLEASKMRINNNGQVAWSTLLTVGTGGVTSATSAVLLQTTLGGVTDNLIARQGSSLSIVPGALCGTFSNLMQNNLGQIVFSTTLTDDASDPNNNVTTSNDLALFAYDPVAGLSLVARERDNLSSIGINMTLTGSWLTMFSQANADGGANALSDSGWLTFKATGTALPGFSDTSAIVRTQIIPTPGAGALVACGLAAMFRRRRNA